MADKVRAFIGLGGNIGNVVVHMQSALNKLNEHKQIEFISVSNIYKTPPWGLKDQDWFLNACVSLDTTFSAHELLKHCLATEALLKRVRDTRWGPRTIDLDVLFFGYEVITEDKLQIPHPRIQDRAFVLKPMADIAPDLRLRNKSISNWLHFIDDSEIQLTEHKLILQS